MAIEKVGIVYKNSDNAHYIKFFSLANDGCDWSEKSNKFAEQMKANNEFVGYFYPKAWMSEDKFIGTLCKYLGVPYIAQVINA